MYDGVVIRLGDGCYKRKYQLEGLRNNSILLVSSTRDDDKAISLAVQLVVVAQVVYSNDTSRPFPSFNRFFRKETVGYATLNVCKYISMCPCTLASFLYQ